MLATLATLAVAAILIAGAVWDVATRRIPNWLMGAGLLAALVAVVAVSGPGALATAALAGAVVFVLGFAGFVLGAVGGGDAKLLVVAGVWVGLAGVVPLLLLFAVLGGLLAFVEIARRRAGVEAAVATLGLARHFVTLGRSGHRARLGDDDRLAIPYGVAIAGAALLVQFTAVSQWVMPL
jgi:prepilin peptidase CpaA